MAAKPRRASDNKLEQLQALADQIAAMRTDDEIQDGLSGDDAAETIGSLVTWARTLSDHRPDPSTVYQHPDDAYPFTAQAPGAPVLADCAACKGTGEITEYPADDDERLVACPTCGGTGEAYT